MNEPSVPLNLQGVEHDLTTNYRAGVAHRYTESLGMSLLAELRLAHSALRRIVEEARPLAAKPWGLKAAIEAASKVLERVRDET